jgi:hypothetical protein
MKIKKKTTKSVNVPIGPCKGDLVGKHDNTGSLRVCVIFKAPRVAVATVGYYGYAASANPIVVTMDRYLSRYGSTEPIGPEYKHAMNVNFPRRCGYPKDSYLADVTQAIGALF